MRARDVGFGAVVGGTALIAGQVAYAGHRRLPATPDLDVSGRFGGPRSPSLRLCLLGDSAMTAQGLDDIEGSWPRLVARHLADRYHVELESFAVGGARTDDLLRRQVPRAELSQYDVVVISAGGNDIMRAKPMWRVERNLDESVARLKTVARSVILFGVGDLGSVPRLPFPSDRLASLSGHVADLVHRRVAARHGVAKIDQWRLTTSAFNSGPEMFAPDLFHPSAAGHQAWAEAVIPTLEEELKRIGASFSPAGLRRLTGTPTIDGSTEPDQVRQCTSNNGIGSGKPLRPIAP